MCEKSSLPDIRYDCQISGIYIRESVNFGNVWLDISLRRFGKENSDIAIFERPAL